MDIDVTIGNEVTTRGGGVSALGRIDQYELVRELGTGGFGKVYLARDTTSDIDVALKVIGNDRKSVCCSFGWNGTTMQGAAGGANGLENELRENFKLIHGLTHPNIAVSYPLHLVRDVKAAGVSIGRGDVLSVMAFASGVTLDKWRKTFAGGRVPVRLVADIVSQIASALDYAHANGVIHRDVKPSNVMVDTGRDGKPVVRLLDFGLAAADGGKGICGTPRYMSPEQWRGDRQDKGTDQYALGALACELLTGHVPFESVFAGDDREVMKAAVVNRELELPRELSDRQRKVVAKAMAKAPENRFASCTAFAHALEGSSSNASGRKLLIAGAVLVALALSGVGGRWIWKAPRDVEPQPPEPQPQPAQPPMTSLEQPRPSAEPAEPLPAKPSPLPVKPPAPPAEQPRPPVRPQPPLVEEPA